MYRGKRILAIIPARSGSKGLKDKNIKKLVNKPMIAYTIEAAKKSCVFSDIVVSTDSQVYAEISKEYGAEAPFLRDKELSSDIAKTSDVIIDTINKLKKLDKEYDYFVLLQATSPLRNENDIKNAVDLLIDNNLDSTVSVCELEYPLEIINKLGVNNSIEGFIRNNNDKRRQEMEKQYRINGAIYMCKTKIYMEEKNFYGTKSKAYIMSNENSIDIDTLLDFNIATNIMNNRIECKKLGKSN